MNRVALDRLYGWYEIQSLFSMNPAVRPPSALVWSVACTPDWAPKCSPWRCFGCRVLMLCVVRPPLSV